MKYIQSRKQFIGEAVEVKTNRYQRTHGKKPKGFGQWAFYFDDMGGEPMFVPKAMNYSDAVKWAKGEAKKAGKREIYVGESLNEARKPKAWDSMFSMNAIKAYQDGEFDLDDKASILAWDTKYNGGRPPKPAFNTKEIVDYAIKTGKKPDGSKMEESITEGEVLLFDELNDSFDDLSTKISKLMDRTDDPKWNRALQSMMNQLEKLISFAAKNDTKLGVITVNEKRSTPYGELMLDLDAAMKKAIKDGVTTLRYAQDYVKSLERMAKKNAKSFFKSYGDFTEEDWIEDVRYNMANENLTENYDTEQRKEMASKGLALPDGSFPIKNIEDLKNAIQAYGRAKDQAKAAKFIAKRAKALNADDLIPDTEDFQKALKEAEFGRIPKFGE